MTGDGPQKKDDNVIKISEARRKQRTLQRAGASQANGKWNKGSGQPKAGDAVKNKFWFALQFILFMGAVAWLMHQCRG